MIAWVRITPNGLGLWIASPSEFKVYSTRRHALFLFGWAVRILPRVPGRIFARRLGSAELERLRDEWEKAYTGRGLACRKPSIVVGSEIPLRGKWFGFRLSKKRL